MAKNYGKKTIWLDPDDVMEYGTDPETVRRYKIIDAKKARLKSIRYLAKYLDTSNTVYQPDTRFRSLVEGPNRIFATSTNTEAEAYLKVIN